MSWLSFRLACIVAHDFNNLLLVIRGQAALFTHAFCDGTPFCRELTRRRKAADRASTFNEQKAAYLGSQAGSA